MNKNCFSEVRLEQRSTRKDGKWNMDIWGYNILGSEKLKFKIFWAEAGSVWWDKYQESNKYLKEDVDIKIWVIKESGRNYCKITDTV